MVISSLSFGDTVKYACADCLSSEVVVLALVIAAKAELVVVIVEAVVEVESREDCPLSFVCYLVPHLKLHLSAGVRVVEALVEVVMAKVARHLYCLV